MSIQRGLAALSCRHTDRIARTEFSANMHWKLVEKVTGIRCDIIENRAAASGEFIKAWDYDFFWYVHACTNKDRTRVTYFPDHGGLDYLRKTNPKARRTSMGHAVYMESVEGKNDYTNEMYAGFKDFDDALALDPVKEYGILNREALAKEFQDAYDELTTHLPDTLTSGGVYTTLFSGLIEIYGWEMLLMLITEPAFEGVVEGYYQWAKQLYDAYADTTIPVIVSHDDLVWTSGPAANPAWYRAQIIPRIKKLWEPLKRAGKKIVYTCDGNMTEFIDDMINAGADMIVTEPMTNFEYLAERYAGKVSFFGAFDTRIILLGTKDEIYTSVRKHIDRYGHIPGYFFGTGNHIPPNTPVDNVLQYQEAFEKYAKR